MEPLAWVRMKSEVRGRYNRTSSENFHIWSVEDITVSIYKVLKILQFPYKECWISFLKGTQVQTVGRQHVSGRGRPCWSR